MNKILEIPDELLAKEMQLASESTLDDCDHRFSGERGAKTCTLCGEASGVEQREAQTTIAER